jgi:hypothetical protein
MTTNIPNISLNEGSLISYAELSAFYFLLAVIPVAKKSRKLWRRSEQFYSPVSEEEARNFLYRDDKAAFSTAVTYINEQTSSYRIENRK